MHRRASSFCTGLVRNDQAPCSRPRSRSSSAVMICTGMWRVFGSSFRRSSTFHPSHVRQTEVERDRRRVYVPAPSPGPSTPRRGNQPFKAMFARKIQQDNSAKLISSSTIITTRSPGWMFVAVILIAAESIVRPRHSHRTGRRIQIDSRRDHFATRRSIQPTGRLAPARTSAWFCGR